MKKHTEGTHEADNYHSAQIEPLWHAWMSYAVDTPPTLDPIAKVARSWAKPYHIPNYTASRAAYKPYNTYVSCAMSQLSTVLIKRPL